MIIEKINIGSITSNKGTSYDVFFDATKLYSNECVIFDGKLGGEYSISSILRHSIISSDEDDFILPKSYDDDEEIIFSTSEIKKLAKLILNSIPVKIGELIISVTFKQYDPRVPF